MSFARIFKTLAGIAALVIAAVVTYFAVIFDGPFPDHPVLRGKNDLALHVAAFLALSAPLLLLDRWCRTVAGLVMFAGLIEIVQIFQSRRSAEWADFAASVAGIALGALVVIGLRGIKSWLASNKDQMNE